MFQAICSYHMQPLANTIRIAHLRMSLAIVCTVFFILLSVTGVISHLQFKGMLRQFFLNITYRNYVMAARFRF